ncbi:MAG TPA: 50S ribosomal protein L21e [Candidatus Krumholzibacteriaceae bacterium]|jgi:large subunit ribosomal protein L21e|nr:50S ribosomal protein L21e [Candidatus Krumholzibacteriaceae bacterium]
MKRSRGYRTKTRSLLTREPRQKGKIGLSKLLHDYQPGEKVVVKINSTIQKGMPHRRFHGKTGVVTSKRGRAYTVNVSQGEAVKEIIVRPEHLTPLSEGKHV